MGEYEELSARVNFKRPHSSLTRNKNLKEMSDSEDFSGNEGGEVQPFQFKTNFNTIENLAPEVLRRVKALKNIQLENVKQEVEYYKELHKLDLKYQRIYDENNVRRKKIYLGDHEPNDTECEWMDPDDEDGSKKLGALKLEGDKKET